MNVNDSLRYCTFLFISFFPFVLGLKINELKAGIQVLIVAERLIWSPRTMDTVNKASLTIRLQIFKASIVETNAILLCRILENERMGQKHDPRAPRKLSRHRVKFICLASSRHELRA